MKGRIPVYTYMISINKLDDLWAKSPAANETEGESLLAHSLRVISVAKKICDSLPISISQRQEVAREAVLCAALHDSGKAALGFQLSLRGRHWGRRHEMLSLAIASEVANDLSAAGLFAIATHHKAIEYFDDVFNGQQIPSDKSSLWQGMVENLLIHKELLVQYLNLISLNGNPKMEGLDKLLLETRLKKAWFSKEYQSYKIDISQRRHASLLRGLLITADHLASAHQFALPEVPIQKAYITTIYKQELKGQRILPFQQRCAETRGDAILKAPTGSGKTAAILLWAANNQVDNGRLFYVLPHTASINAMHGRLQKIYGDKIVGVLHHKNAAYLYRVFENDYSSTEAAKMAQTISGLARELYHPIRVTTPHQILRVALRGKGWELGLAEFPNACFVFDEIHAFEPLLIGLTLATVKWLKRMGGRVLFSSATLPLFLEKILKEEIGISDENIILPNFENEDDRAVLEKIRHKIKIREGSLIANIEIIKSELRTDRKRVLIVCNHVATAQQVFAELQKEFKNSRLLHARFNAEDRFKIEKEIQGNNPPRILVATQAVEVSLDLDYDCGYIEPAPADALGQRLGRINRKGSRTEPAPVVIFEKPSALSGERPLYLPYDKETTEETINFLRKCNLLSEQQLTDIVNKIYEDGYKGDSFGEYKRGIGNTMINNFDQNIIAGAHRDWVEDVIEDSDGQIEALPADFYDTFKTLKEEKRYLEAKLLLVPIQTRQCRRLIKERILSLDHDLSEYIVSLKYSSDYGLDLKNQIDNIL